MQQGKINPVVRWTKQKHDFWGEPGYEVAGFNAWLSWRISHDMSIGTTGDHFNMLPWKCQEYGDLPTVFKPTCNRIVSTEHLGGMVMFNGKNTCEKDWKGPAHILETPK